MHTPKDTSMATSSRPNVHTPGEFFRKVVDTDEHPRPDASAEKMGGLRPVFKKGGVVTAANASGICDGAGRYE